MNLGQLEEKLRKDHHYPKGKPFIMFKEKRVRCGRENILSYWSDGAITVNSDTRSHFFNFCYFIIKNFRYFFLLGILLLILGIIL